MEDYLAKSQPKEETIGQHTQKILEQFEWLMHLYFNYLTYREWEMLKEACAYHDLGKIQTSFQNFLRKKLKKEMLEEIITIQVPHGHISPAFLPYSDYLKRGFTKKEIAVIVQAIFYHHHRPNPDFKEITEVIKNDILPKYDKLNYFFIQKEGLRWDYERLTFRPKSLRSRENREQYYQYVKIKGLLNKIDYAASCGIDVELKTENYREKAEKYIQKKGSTLNDMQLFMKMHKDKNLVVIASTAYGKTEGVMQWIGSDKAVYTLPIQVSINAMYDRVLKELGLNPERVRILHSNILSELLHRRSEEESTESDSLELKFVKQMKQYSMPFTISTLDQFVDFIFGYEGSEVKLATLMYSKLVIDEIQMYDPKMLAYLLIGLQRIVEIGGRFAVVTATFPPIFERWMKELDIPFEKPEMPFLNDLQRHIAQVYDCRLTAVDVKKVYQEDKKILIIMNSVTEAQNIYRELSTIYPGKVNLLHKRFTKQDRSIKENEILSMGTTNSNETGIWISTSIVEASLNIDFDLLLTELSEVCGLFQRLGRVFRKRIYSSITPNVYIFTGSRPSYIDKNLFQLSKEALLSFDGGFLTEGTKGKMVDYVYEWESIKDSEYVKTVEDTIRDYQFVMPYTIDKKNIDLRGIDTVTVIPKRIYEENREKIEEILETLKEENSWEEKIRLKDQIEQYTLSIPRNKLKHEIVYEELTISRYEKIPVVSYFYSKEEGLVF